MNKEEYQNFRDRQRQLEVPEPSLARVRANVLEQITETVLKPSHQWKPVIVMAAVACVVIASVVALLPVNPKIPMADYQTSVVFFDNHTAVLLIPQEPEGTR